MVAASNLRAKHRWMMNTKKKSFLWGRANRSGAFPAAALFSSAQLFERLTAVTLLIGHGMALAKWG
jgi:hypothetical protein